RLQSKGAGGFDFAGPRRKIEAARELHSSTRIELDPGEDVALLRALEHLRPYGLSRELARLREALIGWTGPETSRYALELHADGQVRTADFTSYAGPYIVGDVLPVPDKTNPECWEVR